MIKRSFPMEELIWLPEERAVQKHFDGRNYASLQWLLVVVSAVAIVAAAAFLEEGRRTELALVLFNLGVILTVFALRRTKFFEENFRYILMVYLLAQFLILLLPDPGTVLWWPSATVVAAAYLPVILILFRLRPAEELLLTGVVLGTAVWRIVAAPQEPDGSTSLARVAAIILMNFLALAVTTALTRQRRERFVAGWRREHLRERERSRMREELNDARKIQLSMLPQSTPDVGWVDLSSICLPASEVGGDYFDYFRLGNSRLAIVIGDVAGHGVASGLLLSGVRSCLYLLQEQLTSPVEVMKRLNRMIQQAAFRRMFMTLLIGVLDRDRRHLSLVTAGHPPLLHYSSRSNRVDEVGDGALPLGTHLEVRYRQQMRSLEAGDVLVFCSDGLMETANLHGKEYGPERLVRELRRAAPKHGARGIRDAILADLTNFKGDAERRDDVTLVVAKVRGGA